MTNATKISTKRAFKKNAWNAIAEELRVEDSAEVEKEFTKSTEK